MSFSSLQSKPSFPYGTKREGFMDLDATGGARRTSQQGLMALDVGGKPRQQNQNPGHGMMALDLGNAPTTQNQPGLMTLDLGGSRGPSSSQQHGMMSLEMPPSGGKRASFSEHLETSDRRESGISQNGLMTLDMSRGDSMSMSKLQAPTLLPPPPPEALDGAMALDSERESRGVMERGNPKRGGMSGRRHSETSLYGFGAGGGGLGGGLGLGTNLGFGLAEEFGPNSAAMNLHLEEGAGPERIFQPHGKQLDELPAWNHLKVRTMLHSARQAQRVGVDIDYERRVRWAEVVGCPYGDDMDSKVTGLLKIGYPPSVISGLEKALLIIDEAVDNRTGEGECYDGKTFAKVVRKMMKLLGVREETMVLLLTTRGTDPRRIMENQDIPTHPDVGDEDGLMHDDEEGAAGSNGKAVVTFSGLLDNLLIFTPVSGPEDKLDLLIEMYDSGSRAEDYISMEDVQRMLTWLVKEADYSLMAHLDIAEFVMQRLVRDYIRALRETDWNEEPDIETHPDEILLAQITEEGLQRFVLEQILLSAERGGKVRFKPDQRVIIQGVKSKDMNGCEGKISKKDPKHRGHFLVQLPNFGEKRIKQTNLRNAPGVEKIGDIDPEKWGLYLPLCLNIRPRSDIDIDAPSTYAWKRVQAWVMRNFLPIVFLTGLVLTFGFSMYFRYYERDDVQKLFGAAGAIGGATAWCIRLIVVLVMISGCQAVLRKVPNRFRIVADAAKYSWIHILMAGSFILMTMCHVGAEAEIFNIIKSKTAAEVNSVLGTSFTPLGENVSELDLVKTRPAWTGLTMIGIMFFMGVCSGFGKDTWIFHLGHRLYIPLVIIMCLHPMEGWFEWKYGTLVWLGLPFLIALAEFYFHWEIRRPFVCDEVHDISIRGQMVGIEFRVRRPEGEGMVRQQAGEYVEVMTPGVNAQWKWGSISTAPELEDEIVRIQVVQRSRTRWLKVAEELLLQERLREIHKIKIRGPFGLAAYRGITPVSKGGSGKVLLVANADGVLVLTSVMNDLFATLSRPDDAVRRRMSKLHQITEAYMLDETVKLEFHIVAVMNAMEGNKRFWSSLLHLISLQTNTLSGNELTEEYDSSSVTKVTFSIHLTEYCAQGTGVDCWKRLKKLGNGKHEGRADARNHIEFEDNIKYGPPDLDHVLKMMRYRWLGKDVDVIHYGSPQHAEKVEAACKLHSFSSISNQARLFDKTSFNFHRGDTPTSN